MRAPDQTERDEGGWRRSPRKREEREWRRDELEKGKEMGNLIK